MTSKTSPAFLGFGFSLVLASGAWAQAPKPFVLPDSCAHSASLFQKIPTFKKPALDSFDAWKLSFSDASKYNSSAQREAWASFSKHLTSYKRHMAQFEGSSLLCLADLERVGPSAPEAAGHLNTTIRMMASVKPLSFDDVCRIRDVYGSQRQSHLTSLPLIPAHPISMWNGYTAYNDKHVTLRATVNGLSAQCLETQLPAGAQIIQGR